MNHMRHNLLMSFISIEIVGDANQRDKPIEPTGVRSLNHRYPSFLNFTTEQRSKYCQELASSGEQRGTHPSAEPKPWSGRGGVHSQAQRTTPTRRIALLKTGWTVSNIQIALAGGMLPGLSFRAIRTKWNWYMFSSPNRMGRPFSHPKYVLRALPWNKLTMHRQHRRRGRSPGVNAEVVWKQIKSLSQRRSCLSVL
jgi:hypothetical protein